MADFDLDAIRQRHERDSDDVVLSRLDGHADRGVLLAEVERLEDLLHTVWLHTAERGPMVKDMTTDQKERYADAVEAVSGRLNAGSTCECGCRDGVQFERWWR